MTEINQNTEKTNITASTKQSTNITQKNIILGVVTAISTLFFIFALFQFFAPESIKPFKTQKEATTEVKTTDNKQLENKKEETKGSLVNGKITGKLSYPTDTGIPGQNVCAKNVGTNSETCTKTTFNDKQPFVSYELNLPAGDYNVYVNSITLADGKEYKQEIPAYYNKYVTECLDKQSEAKECQGDSIPESYHTTLNKVVVNAGKTTENINPTDWYYVPANYKNGAIVPDTTNKTVATTNTSTYTNQYFPNFKLVYGNDWKFSTTTRVSPLYSGLLERSLDLAKNGTQINISLAPGVGGCGGSGYASNIKNFNNGLKRFTISNSDDNGQVLNFEEIIYSKSAVEGGGCQDDYLMSNIDTTASPQYKSAFSKHSKVRYGFTIQTSKNNKSLASEGFPNGTAGEPVKISDTAILDEIDKIISESVFN